MSTYQFEMADDETHACVLVAGNVIGTIQNVPDYLGGGLSFGSNGDHHPHPMPGDDMWDAFDTWIAPRAAAQSRAQSDATGESDVE
jgi:hypothetical protein